MTLRIFRVLGCIAVAVAALLGCSHIVGAADEGGTSNVPRYTKDGKLLRPNYREWVYLSSGLGMNYGPTAAGATAAPAFTNVFVNPESYREFQKTGKWPDK